MKIEKRTINDRQLKIFYGGMFENNDEPRSQVQLGNACSNALHCMKK